MPVPVTDRLERQLGFLIETDRLKSVLRGTPLADGTRLENSAEHSWHIALTALVLAEHAPRGVQLRRVLQMLLIHDIVEIDAGDTFCYDPAPAPQHAQRERNAADRLFALLPEQQAVELRALWDEFEQGDSPDARFANAVDRLQPLLLDMQSGGGSWRNREVSREQVIERMQPVRRGLPALWAFVERAVAEAHGRGWLR